MNVNECIRERLLRRISIDKEKVRSSIKTAEQKIFEAKELFAKEFFNQAVVNAYTAMFHSARAILYKDGIQEKSHYAVFVYLNEEYSKKLPKSILNSFDNYRKERHNILYGFEHKASKDDAESAILDAEEFLDLAKEIVGYG